MAKLLETRLPTAIGSVEPELYNRMVRVLEINLGRFDPTATPQYNDTTLNKNQYAAGDVIWNTVKTFYRSIPAVNGRIYQLEPR